MLYALNLYNVIGQLYLNKAGKKYIVNYEYSPKNVYTKFKIENVCFLIC